MVKMKKLLSDITVELHVPNFELTKDFYGDLGFKVVWERKPNQTMKGYMVMRRAESIINFYCGNEQVYDHPFFGKFDKNTPRGYGVEVVIPVDGIEVFYQKVKEKYSNKIVRPLSKKYEKPDFRMIDPFGFYLRFVERYNWVDTRNFDGSKK